MVQIKINVDLLPIKSHYFCFMAAMGPILPQLSVYGREMGIPSSVMGVVTGILPILFLIAKPVFGLIVDIFRDYRKSIFVGLIVTMAVSYALLVVIPPRALAKHEFRSFCDKLQSCNDTGTENDGNCSINRPIEMVCSCTALRRTIDVPMVLLNSSQVCVQGDVDKTCTLGWECDFNCIENVESNDSCLYKTWEFWCFIIFMSIGTIGFNVSNSISDAICFDVIGDEYDYGKQRVWGTIGFGMTALLSGYIVNWVSHGYTSYTPAFIIMMVFILFDLFACAKLKLPIMEKPENIFKDLGKLLQNRHTVVFILYAIFAGVVDSFMIYYAFWYLEDLAATTHTTNVKLLEGLIVAAETLGGEVIFFSISGKILERFGHASSFSMCFINYALRLGLLSIVPSPWWILPIEFLMQGPTYALTYTTIVAYANAIAPPGTSATMQGIAAGMDDGFGYALGSLLGGILYEKIGGRGALQVFSVFALVCSISHMCLCKIFLHHHKEPNQNETEYKNPAEAALAVYDTSTVSDIHCI